MKPADEFDQFLLSDNNVAEPNNNSEEISPSNNQAKGNPEITSFSHMLKNRDRRKWIAESAYFIAEHRGFAPGHALDDWLKAERLFNEMLVHSFFEFSREDGEITVTGLKQLARAVGVKNSDKLYSKIELICAIQTLCNSVPCFKTEPVGKCITKPDCLWESECQKLIAEWQR